MVLGNFEKIYQCQKCGHIFSNTDISIISKNKENLLKNLQKKLKQCPKCKSKKIKIINKGCIVFPENFNSK